jgi:hypothetical protein
VLAIVLKEEEDREREGDGEWDLFKKLDSLFHSLKPSIILPPKSSSDPPWTSPSPPDLLYMYIKS